MTRRSKGCSLRPPNPQPYPWWMISHGRSSRVSSFYSVLEKRNYITKIPDLSDKDVGATCQGWLVIMDSDIRGECLLLNLASMQRIKLPAFASTEKMELLDNYINGYCLLTAPPTASNCIIGFFACDRPSALIWRPGQEDWVEQEYGVERLKCATVCNDKIYGFVQSMYLAVCEFVDEKLVVRRLGLSSDPLPRGGGVVKFERYLVGSCGDIFYVVISTLGETTDRIKHIDVYKFDTTNSEWIQVENIGDRAFFLNDVSHSISCSAENSGLRGNCIYFSRRGRDGTSLYTYDMEENHIHVYEPCPNAVNNRSRARFIMVQP